METSELSQLSEDLIRRFGSFESMMSNELFQQNNLYEQMDDQDDDDTESDDIIVMHMDIRQPLSSLQKILEKKVGVILKGYKFWLQDAQELEPHKNLVDQCVKGEGLVQINVQIQTIIRRINIVDVLKPTEAALAELAIDDSNKNKIDSIKGEPESEKNGKPKDLKVGTETKAKPTGTIATKMNSQERPCLNWVLDNKFKKEQARLKIPEDPFKWTVPQVRHWFQWAMRQFNLTDITMSDWTLTGKELCSLSHEEFRDKLPLDPGNIFWTHLQLLKECKFVSVVHKAAEDSEKERCASTLGNNVPVPVQKEQKIMRKSVTQTAKIITTVPIDGSTHVVAGGTSGGYGVGSGNNGQVQLWQFLLEILTDREHVNIIQWVGSEGEFKLVDPERVARLWGLKKKKPAMNYEKLSRALRYYYDGDMISKVSGKRFAYKFDCDLKLLVGYTAAELAKLVNENSNSFITESPFLSQMQSDDE